MEYNKKKIYFEDGSETSYNAEYDRYNMTFTNICYNGEEIGVVPFWDEEQVKEMFDEWFKNETFISEEDIKLFIEDLTNYFGEEIGVVPFWDEEQVKEMFDEKYENEEDTDEY